MTEGPSIGRILSENKYECTGLLSEKTGALHAELKERVEVATSSYSVEIDFLQYIYSVVVAKKH